MTTPQQKELVLSAENIEESATTIVVHMIAPTIGALRTMMTLNMNRPQVARALALAITKLEETEMWLARACSEADMGTASEAPGAPGTPEGPIS